MTAGGNEKGYQQFFLRKTADLVALCARRAKLTPAEVVDLIEPLARAVKALPYVAPSHEASPAPALSLLPAIPIKKSFGHDFVACLECGQKRKTLKRHIASAHSMSLEDYRTKWKLPTDHPTNAPTYLAQRSSAARRMNFGGGLSKKAARDR